jgi:hypothetical protein
MRTIQPFEVYRLFNGSATVSASLQAESLARESASRESAAARESASLQAQRSSEEHESLQQKDNDERNGGRNGEMGFIERPKNTAKNGNGAYNEAGCDDYTTCCICENSENDA